MARERLIGWIVVVACVVISVYLLVPGTPPAPAVLQPSTRSQPLPDEASSPSDSVASPTAIAFIGFPPDVARDPARRYEFAKDCAKFRHFDAFYREKASDPTWPLNNAKALAAASPERRAQLLETTRFLDRHRQSCTAWLRATPQDLQNAQIYEAALQAARRGDRNAAACFVMASWQTPNTRGPYYERWASTYAAHSRPLVYEGLKAGSWPLVLAASLVGRNEQELWARAGFSAQDSYLLATLAQYGSSNAADEAQYGLEARIAARALSPSEMEATNQQARQLFENEFKRTKTSAKAVTDACVN